MIEHPDFIALTAMEKVLYFSLLNDGNQHPDGWYKADLEYGVEADISTDKVRRARRKFGRLGWLKYASGFRAKGRNLATAYRHVRWSTPPHRGDGVSFAQMERFHFEALMACLRRPDGFRHEDLVVYAVLALVQSRWNLQGKGQDFFITKRELMDSARLDNIASCLERLHENYAFAGGNHLFEYVLHHHKVSVKRWATCADPASDTYNRDTQEKHQKALQEMIEVRRKNEVAKAKKKARKRRRVGGKS